jgi:RNA polymerase sigma factor (sigma-70 family)
MNKQQLFETNENLIYNRAWHYSKKYDIDFQELKSEGYKIFCEAIERFEEKRSKFSTFLFHRLRTIEDYCQREKLIEKRFKVNEFEFNSFDGNMAGHDEEFLKSGKPYCSELIKIEDPIEQKILFEQAVEKLSSDGQYIVANMIYGEFHNPESKRQRTIGKSRVREVIGWGEERVNQVWGELKEWWTNFSPEIVT